MIPTFPVRRVGGLFLEDYETPAADYYSARAEETATFNPTASLTRMGELAQASGEAQEIREFAPGVPLPEEAFPQPRELSPMLTVEEANDRAASSGLTFTEPQRAEVVDIKIRRKRAQDLRQAMMRRGPEGVGPAVAGLGLDLLVSIADPLNVASAFVPVVREARFLNFASRVGTTQARLARGAVEGAAGAAIVEPIVLSAAMQEQADYDAVDSLLNLAFGTVLGGGLHVAGGAAADVIARRTGGMTLSQRLQAASHPVREAALRTAVAQGLQGKTVDVEDIVLDPFVDLEVRRSLADAPQREFDLGELVGEGADARYDTYTRLSNQDRRFLEGVLEDVRSSDSGERLFLEAEGQGGTPEVIGRPATTPEFMQLANRQAQELEAERARVRRLNETRPRDQQLPLPERAAPLTRETVERVGRKLLDNRPLGRAEGNIALELVGEARARREADVANMVAFRQDREAARLEELEAFAAREGADVPGRMSAAAEAAESPRNIDVADFDASVRAEQIVREFPGEDTADSAEELLEDALESAEELRRALEISEEEWASIFAEADEAIEEAQAFGRAARAAALCELRRG